jgi:uncharacterized protein
MDKKLTKKIRIAAVGDIHVSSDAKYFISENFEEINNTADILLLCGDLTNTGTLEEAKNLSSLLRKIHIPIAGVLGNHDVAFDVESDVRRILKEEGRFNFLDESPFQLEGVGFVGVKGFAGGFENHMLSAFGEKALKDFVLESINESLRLETLLSQIQTEKKVVVLHYSPVKETIAGEPQEIFPFLGSSHLSEPINNFNVDIVFHGHAHYGTHQGKTFKNIPVFNVSLNVLQKISAANPLKIFTL